MPDSTISSERDENSTLVQDREKNNPFSRLTSTVGSCDSYSDTLCLTILSIAIFKSLAMFYVDNN